MIINNLEKINRLIYDCGEDEFYMLQIIHRTKDGHTKYEPQEGKSHEQVIKTYYVSSPDYLTKKMPEIIDLCKMFNARAMFNLNKKSWKQISLKSLELMAQAIGKEGHEQKWWKSVRSIVESACGQTGACDGNKVWVLDIDTKDKEELLLVRNIVDACEPIDKDKIIDVFPTIHGYHLLTRPFDNKTFKKLYDESHGETESIIKPNNPTILYAKTQE